MGEYAKYEGKDIKIGTCESMYHLRYDQRQLVSFIPGNVNVNSSDRFELRFRFPFPWEDNLEPGCFDEYDRGFPVEGIRAPFGVEHYSLQFSHRAGYLLSIPCPEGKGYDLRVDDKPVTIHRNGCKAPVDIVAQKPHPDGHLMLICRCNACGGMWRLETINDAMPVLEKLKETAERCRPDDARISTIRQMVSRILAGYEVNDAKD